MADGLNDARAIRIAEIMTDFRNLQHHISQIRIAPTPEEYYLEGYAILRQCVADAQAVLSSPFHGSPQTPAGNLEREKQQLRSIILDASIRRFQSQRISLRAHAALRWVHARRAILRGQKAHAGLAPALQVVDGTLQAELAALTDQHVAETLRVQDQAEGKWLDEDPSLGTILQILAIKR